MKIGESLFRLERDLRSILLFLRYMNPSNSSDVSHHRTPGGTEYDVYESPSPQKTFLLLYGWDMAGEKDVRLVRLAEALARSGCRAIVPSLPGLKSFRFDRGDLEIMTDLVKTLHANEPLGIVAFSAGAGMALVFASDPSMKDKIDPLLLFGPYHSLSWLQSSLICREPPNSAGAEEWDNFIWIRMVLAFRNMDSCNLCDHERSELINLLYNYCNGESLGKKREFYERVLKGKGIVSGKVYTDESETEAFSPQGKLKTLTGRILILHDACDTLISPEHSRRIMEELAERKVHNVQRLLITPLLSHVNLRSSSSMPDLFGMMDIVGEIFRK